MSYVICEQQRRRSACASAQSDQRLCCSLLIPYNISRFYSRNFKTLASFCGCAGRFVSGRVGNSLRHVLSCCGSYHKLLSAVKPVVANIGPTLKYLSLLFTHPTQNFQANSVLLPVKIIHVYCFQAKTAINRSELFFQWPKKIGGRR